MNAWNHSSESRKRWETKSSGLLNVSHSKNKIGIIPELVINYWSHSIEEPKNKKRFVKKKSRIFLKL